MNKEEADLISAELNRSTEEILKAVAKVKSDYQKMCILNEELKNLMRSEHEIEARKNNRLISQLTEAKELLKWWVNHCGNHDLHYAKRTEQFLNSEVEK